MTNAFLFALFVFFMCIIGAGCSHPVMYAETEQDFRDWAYSMERQTTFDTLTAMNEWMQSHMTYEKDPLDGAMDYFKPVEKTWWQSGDCEDWSRVACEALHIQGRKDFILLSVFYDNTGHTVCTDGQYHISNWGLFTGLAGMRSVVEQVSAGRWVKYIVRDVDLSVLEIVKR